MTTATMVKTFLEVLVVVLVAYGIFNEKKVIRFERNFAKVVKACVKEIMRKDVAPVKEVNNNIVELQRDDIAAVAEQHEKKSKIIDFKIA